MKVAGNLVEQTKDSQKGTIAEGTARHLERRPRLGRGLAALLADTQNPDVAGVQSMGSIRTAPIELIRTNPNNPRRAFNEKELDELANSIRERGIIQPIIVRAAPDGSEHFEIIAGERRWRSAQRAGLHVVPTIIVEATDRESLELAIIENVQRSDLNPIEEATGYAKLCAEHGYSHADISRIIGKSRSHVTNTLRLLNLPDLARSMLETGKITSGHARALLTVANPDAVAQQVVTSGLTVREVERIEKVDVASGSQEGKKDAVTIELEASLSLALGATVQIKTKGEKGDIRISFANLEQLDDIIYRLRQGFPH